MPRFPDHGFPAPGVDRKQMSIPVMYTDRCSSIPDTRDHVPMAIHIRTGKLLTGRNHDKIVLSPANETTSHGCRIT